MIRPQTALRASLLVMLGGALLAGCAGGGDPIHTSTRGAEVRPARPVSPGRDFTRRGVERSFAVSPEFGSPRGRAFEDIIPVGARITAVHVSHGAGIEGIRLSYERNGMERETPLRGTAIGQTDVFRLDADEKIIGMDAWGIDPIAGLVIASNKRTVSFGAPRPTIADPPAYKLLTELERQHYVAIGIAGRADSSLHQLKLRVQIRTDG
jgi:hypothetical protein